MTVKKYVTPLIFLILLAIGRCSKKLILDPAFTFLDWKLGLSFRPFLVTARIATGLREEPYISPPA